jgi:hypothetical protein
LDIDLEEERVCQMLVQGSDVPASLVVIEVFRKIDALRKK